MASPQTTAGKEVLAKLPAVGNVWPIFLRLVEIPRGSYNHEYIVPFIKSYCEEKGFEFSVDDDYNMLIKCKASPGKEDKPTVCLQGHWDIVSQKEDDMDIDLKKDPLVPRIVVDDKGKEWLMATKTSLGADDGIGVAMALNAASDEKIQHGPLEILITANEEVGLLGASKVKSGSLKSKYIINIDSEDVGVITVSCSGAFRVMLELEEHTEEKEKECASLDNRKNVNLMLMGLTGGHTGIEINKPLGNAIKLLGRIISYGLEALGEDKNKVNIVNAVGGTTANAIARKAEMMLSLPADLVEKFTQKCQEEFGKIKEAYKMTDPSIQFVCKTEDATMWNMNSESLQRLLSLLELIPHGVQRLSPTVAGLIETSMATSVLSMEGKKVSVLCSCRSCIDDELDALYHKLSTLAKVCGFTISNPINRYSGWPANPDAELTKVLAKSWRESAQELNYEPAEAKIEAIHAGLECGIIVSKHPGMEAVSIGPTLVQPHSTQEALLIDTVAVTNDTLVRTLKYLCE